MPCCRPERLYFPRSHSRAALLVEDPLQPELNLSMGSYKFQAVRKAFQEAYESLSRPVQPAEAILKRILR